MSEVAVIRRNSFFSFLSSSTRLLTNIVLFIGIARYYGPIAFGQFTFAHTYLTLFFLVADFGLDTLLTTEISRNRAQASEILARLFPLKVIFSLLSVATMCLIAAYSTIQDQTRVLMFVLSIGILGNALSTFFFALFKGYEQLHHETWISFLQNLFLICGLLVLGIINAPLIYVAVIFTLSRIIGSFIALPKAFTLIQYKLFPISLRNLHHALQRGLPFGIHLLFGTLYFQLDTLLLAYWQGDQAVGIYQAAMKLVVFVLVIPDIIVSALLPVLSRLHGEDHTKWLNLGKLLQKTLLYFSLPFALIFFVYADKIISVVYGSNEFNGAASLLRIFAIVLFVRFSIETFALMLTTSGRQSVRMWIVIFVTVFNFAFNSYVIPRFGVMGAAYISLVTNIIAGICYILAARTQKFRTTLIFQPRVIILLLLTVCFAFFLWKITIDSFYIGIASVFLLYPVLYYVFGYSSDERSLIFALPRKVI